MIWKADQIHSKAPHAAPHLPGHARNHVLKKIVLGGLGFLAGGPLGAAAAVASDVASSALSGSKKGVSEPAKITPATPAPPPPELDQAALADARKKQLAASRGRASTILTSSGDRLGP